METTVKQRIMKFIEASGLSASAFERRAKLSNGYLNSLRNCPSPSKLTIILDAFPELDRTWLLTGEGDMFGNSEQPAKEDAAPSDSGLVHVDRLLSIIEADRQIIREAMAKKDEFTDRLLSIMEADRGIAPKKEAI